ncbi:hypothetical protein ACMFMF_011694 [Clarireedia jacksonii]
MARLSPLILARGFATTCLLIHTALGSDDLGLEQYGFPPISFQAAVATTLLPAATDSAALLAMVKPLAPAFKTARNRCPVTCSEAGEKPSNWTVYHSIDRLSLCDQPVLLDFAIYNPLNDPSTHVSIRSCSATDNTTMANTETLRRLRRDTAVSCVPAANDLETQVSVQTKSIGSASANSDVVEASQQLLNYLSQTNNTDCKQTALFASSGKASVGLFAGSQVQAQGLHTTELQQLITTIQSSGVADSFLVQICASDGRGSDFALGIATSVDSGLDFVQNAVATWSNGSCVTAYKGKVMDLSTTSSNATLWVPAPSVNVTASNTTNSTTLAKRTLYVRGDCTTVQVVSGDGCGSLATKCGISAADFTTYNPSTTLCSTLAIGESAGTLPDLAPQKNSDGSCSSYALIADDTCDNLAATYTITTDNIETWNSETWGWHGCTDLQVGQIICLSTGTPPMPATLANAVCGPQVVGTLPPNASQTLSELNPCPLNACCDIWGQCGITDKFCTNSTSSTGAPGTAADGGNGCISNCGTRIVIGDAPAEFRKIGYFEGFEDTRLCLNMDVSEIDTSNYTHIHLGFAQITGDFDVNTTVIQDQFDSFVTNVTGVKKILSFGGWSFSTDADTSPIFRQGVTEANRNLFATNLAGFIATNLLDGVDFDWEYPGATDIPGLISTPEDGANYLAFLIELRALLPSELTISISAPASFWYLQHFPIEAMAAVVDYIIFMTYDLHGQWDYGNAFSQDGCAAGNCLRSHVNITETVYAFSMITKAGVPTNKLVAGISSYGRSFKMTEAGCSGPDCTFTGPDSGATPGICTLTAGYISDAEVNAIAVANNISSTYDGSFSNILVYNDTQWVAYMDPYVKSVRHTAYVGLNLGGTSEWAIDLESYVTDDGEYDDDEFDSNANSTAPCDYSLSFETLADLEAVADQYSVYCAEIYGLMALSAELTAAYANYTNVNNGYDDAFAYYVKYVRDEVPSAMTEFMDTGNGYVGPAVTDSPGQAFFTCTLHVNGKNTSVEACPIVDVNGYYDVYYTLTNSTGFYDALENKYGIDPTWIEFGSIESEYCDDVYPENSGCVQIGTWYGYPQKASTITVTNPKDLVTAAGPNMETIQATIDATYIDTIMGQWTGSALDTLQVLAMPVATLKQAISAMAVVKALGEEQKEADEAAKKNLIIEILGAIFTFVPFLGEAGALVDGFVQLGRVVALLGEAANGGLGIYSIVKDPTSAPMVIFGYLVGAGALARDATSFAKMGTLRRDMSDTDVTGFGTIFADQSTSINKIVRSCST